MTEQLECPECEGPLILWKREWSVYMDTDLFDVWLKPGKVYSCNPCRFLHLPNFTPEERKAHIIYREDDPDGDHHSQVPNVQREELNQEDGGDIVSSS